MVQNVVFVLMMIIAVGAGVVTAVYEVAVPERIKNRRTVRLRKRKNRVTAVSNIVKNGTKRKTKKYKNKTCVIKLRQEWRTDMSIGMWLMVIIGGAAGLFSTLYIVVSMIGILAYKTYRKVRFHASFYD